LAFSAAGAVAAASPILAGRAAAAPRSSSGTVPEARLQHDEGNHPGLRAGSPDDQSRALQAAIDRAAATRVPLALGPGVYRVGDLNLPAGAQLIGVRGATRLVLTRGPSLASATGADAVTLSGLTLDGAS